MLYSDILNGINDRLNNKYYTDTHSNEILRVINQALRDINVGKITDNPASQPRRRVGYDFQRESTDLAYVSGTERYTLSTYITDLTTLKWIEDVLIDSDENRKFIKRSASYFRKKRGINYSTERMFAEEYINGTKSILIYHSETHTLNLIWYSNYLVTYGGTRQLYFVDGATLNNQQLLIPDEFVDAVIDIAVGYSYRQDRNEQSLSSNAFLNSGRQTLMNMISSLGRYEKKPLERIGFNSEWGLNDN